jgi:hypothetical protein
MKVKDIVSEDGPIAGQPQMGKVTKTQPGVGNAPGTVTVSMPNGVTQTIPTNMISMGPDGKPMVNQQQQTQSNQQTPQTNTTAPTGQPPIAMGQDLAMSEEGSEDIKSVLAQQKVPYYVDLTTGMVNAGGSRVLKIRVDPALDKGPDAGEGSSPVVLQAKTGGQKVIGYMGASGVRLSQTNMQQLSSPTPTTPAPVKSPGMLDRIKSLAGL